MIGREVRGKRTYRIGLGPARSGAARVVSRVTTGVSAADAAGPGTAGFDYDELARRLLVQVVRRLAAPDAEASAPDRSAADRAAHPDQLALQETVSGLKYELAAAWTKHGKLAEENVRLREQLKAAQRSLALAAEQIRRLPASTGLNDSEVVLLQQLLTSEPAAESADDVETPSLLG